MSRESGGMADERSGEHEADWCPGLANTLQQGVYRLDDQRHITAVNDALLELTGYDRADLLGSHLSVLLPGTALARSELAIRRLFAGDTDTQTVSVVVTTAQGEERPCTLSVGRAGGDPGGQGTGDSGDRGAGGGGTVGILTARDDDRTGEQTTQSVDQPAPGEQFEEMIDAVEEYAIFTLDPDGRVVTWNEGAHRIKGYEAALDGDPSDFEASIDGRIYQFHFVPVRDTEGEVFAATGMSQEISDRKQRERELETRVRQQEVVTQLGQRALAEDDLDALFDEAVELVAETLDTDYCKVLERLPDGADLFLRSGVGWRDGLVGSAHVPTDSQSQAGYTLLSEEPVVVPDMDAETRFSGPALLTSHDVKSGISVIIGPPENPWGVLGTHDTDRQTFTDQDVNFVQSVANILTTAIDRVTHERQITEQRERLAALNNLNGIIREIIRVLIQQSTRDDVEELVCDRLAAADSYEFAWVGAVEAATDAVVVHTEAGVENYLDDISITVDDSDDSRGPTGRALTTGEVQVCQDVQRDPTCENWRDRASEYGYRSSVAVPITHENTTYGVLNVYADRPAAFEGEEGAVIAELGEVMGHAINAIERKRLLMSDEVVEIEFRLRNVFADLDGSPAGEFTIEQLIPLSGGAYLGYGTVTENGVDMLDRLVTELDSWQDLSYISESFDSRRFEVRLADPPGLDIVAAHGGHIPTARFADGDYWMTAELPPDAQVRDVVDAIRAAYPTTELLAQRRTATDRASGTGHGIDLDPILTERQRAAIEAAHAAGFFEWPRESTGEDVAEALDISAPTFHQHLRGAQRRLLGAILTDDSCDD